MKNLNEIFETTKNISIQAGFDELANYLMNKCVLEINNDEYRIAEIEFYYFDEKKHNDIHTHRDKCQKKSNVFYFHPAGVDITFGNEHYYGGILLRSIINLQTNEYIIGPHKVAYEEFLKCNKNNKLIIELKEKKLDKKLFFQSCRVNLKIYKENEKLSKDFIFEPYRYILNDENLILNLLNFTESHFLAGFLNKYDFESQKIIKTIKDKIDYINSDSFLKTQEKEKRNLFIKKIINSN